MYLKTPVLSLILMVIATACAFAQESDTKRLSPLDVISMRYKDAYVKVTYSQPSKRGREIFGQLVPYGQVWRTGANEATEITLTKSMQINGTLLKEGTYSLFTIPGKDKWTIIINSEVGLWGAYNYNPKLDKMRFDIPVQSTGSDIAEQFTLQFNQRNELADLLIFWDRVKISIPLKFIN